MSGLIYPFHLESEFPKIYAAYDIDQFAQFAKIYGAQASAVALILYPNAELNDTRCFTGWKLMNKIWTALHNGMVNEHWEIHLKKGNEYFSKQKYHLFMASVFHLFKKPNYTLLPEEKIILANFLKPIFFNLTFF